MKVRKKPVVVDAWRVRDLIEIAKKTPNDLPPPIREACARGDIALFWGLNPEAIIHTLEGIMKADPGSWIIRGVKGEFYSRKPDVFEETYEKVE